MPAVLVIADVEAGLRDDRTLDAAALAREPNDLGPDHESLEHDGDDPRRREQDRQPGHDRAGELPRRKQQIH